MTAPTHTALDRRAWLALAGRADGRAAWRRTWQAARAGAPLDDRAQRTAPSDGPRGVDLPATVARGAVDAVTCFTPADAGYPARLRALGDEAPPLVWMSGAGDFFTRPGRLLAVVGARRCTPRAGHDAARLVSQACAADGALRIASGGARGIDTAAHRATPPGRGLVVLGSGFARVYPPENAALFADLARAGGAVLSPWVPDARPDPWRFPERNRVLAALVEAVLVIQAGARSGALSTAREAAALGRPVAVLCTPGGWPGPGGEALLGAGGATAVRDAAELLDWLDGAGRAADGATAGRGVIDAPVGHGAGGRADSTDAAGPGLGGGGERAGEAPEARVLESLSGDACDAEAIARHCALTVPEALVSLARLELRGLARRDGHGVWRRDRPLGATSGGR